MARVLDAGNAAINLLLGGSLTSQCMCLVQDAFFTLRKDIAALHGLRLAIGPTGPPAPPRLTRLTALRSLSLCRVRRNCAKVVLDITHRVLASAHKHTHVLSAMMTDPSACSGLTVRHPYPGTGQHTR